MFIEIADGGKSDECRAALTVGGMHFDIGTTAKSELRDQIRVLARQLQGRRSFTAEIGCEPLFNIDFDGDDFVAYIWRPRFNQEWLWWLGSRKVVSEPEQVNAATAYLNGFAENIKA